MKVTLGGPRLGSGKKNDVELDGYARSNHDMTQIWRSTASAGTVIPFCIEILTPGTTYDIDIESMIKTLPTIGPIFGSMKAQYDFFLTPVRLYNGRLHNNPIDVGRKMGNVKLPLMRLAALPVPPTVTDIDNAQINPSCLLSQLGIRGVGLHNEATYQTRNFCAIFLLAYWDTIKNYYSNKQEEIGAVIHSEREAILQEMDVFTASGPITGSNVSVPQGPTSADVRFAFGTTINIGPTLGGTVKFEWLRVNTNKGNFLLADLVDNERSDGTTGLLGDYNFNKYGFLHVYNWEYLTPTEMPIGTPRVSTFPLINIDAMRNYILQSTSTSTAPVIINTPDISPYNWLLEPITAEGQTQTNYLNSQEGLAVKTYQSDLFNNWLNTDWIDGVGGITDVTKIDTTGGSFTIDQLVLQKKLWLILNRIAVSDGSYGAWIEATYDHRGTWRAETPVFQGGMSQELIFAEVLSNSESQGDNGTQPLGTLAGHGTLGDIQRGGHLTVRTDEIAVMMGLFSLTPRIDYSQGNAWYTHLETMDDFHKPGFDAIGFQELITEQMAWFDTKWDPVEEEWVTQSAGKQTSWVNYTTNVNVTRGNFAIQNNQMFMTFNRRYQWDGTYDPANSNIEDLTTYIDPAKYNHVFAQTALDAQNFWIQIKCKMTARRKMSAKQIPNL